MRKLPLKMGTRTGQVFPTSTKPAKRIAATGVVKTGGGLKPKVATRTRPALRVKPAATTERPKHKARIRRMIP